MRVPSESQGMAIQERGGSLRPLVLVLGVLICVAGLAFVLVRSDAEPRPQPPPIADVTSAGGMRGGGGHEQEVLAQEALGRVGEASIDRPSAREESRAESESAEPAQQAAAIEMPADPVERERWIAEHRDLYFDADRKRIPKLLESFHTALAEGDQAKARSEAWSLMMGSIATILAKQGRETRFTEGENIYANERGPDYHRFLRNNWVYEFHRSEFPEYFELFVEGSSEEAGVQPFTPAQIASIEWYAERAMVALGKE